MTPEFWIFMGKAFALCIVASGVGGIGCAVALWAMGPTGEGE